MTDREEDETTRQLVDAMTLIAVEVECADMLLENPSERVQLHKRMQTQTWHTTRRQMLTALVALEQLGYQVVPK